MTARVASPDRVSSSGGERLAGVLKLDANESTIAPSPLVEERVRALLADGGAASYPDVEATTLRRRLAQYTARPESEILPFNGCDAAIDCVVRLFASPGDRVCVCSPCYDRFRRCAEAVGAIVSPVFSDDPFIANTSRLLAAIDDTTPVVYVANPNNPTGRVYAADDIAAILSQLSRGVLIVDETYHEFAGTTVIPLLDRFDNLIVMRSFSKAFGLAGIRCGYTLAGERITTRLRRIWSGRDVNAVAQVAAVAALDDLPYMHQYVEDVTRARVWFTGALRGLGYHVVPSPVNFVLVRVADPADFLARLRREGVIIRNRSDVPQLEGFVRITVGTRPQCERVVAAIRRAV